MEIMTADNYNVFYTIIENVLTSIRIKQLTEDQIKQSDIEFLDYIEHLNVSAIVLLTGLTEEQTKKEILTIKEKFKIT